MVTVRRPRLLTLSEYLSLERSAPSRSEYVRGEIYAMTGGTARHSLISANTIRALGNRLDNNRCRVFDSNLRLWVEAADLVTYPDVMVVCGKVQFLDDKPADTVANPAVVVEVLSPSTEAFDRGDKFAAYRLVPSLRHYVLVSQDRPQVEVFTRTETTAFVPSVALGMDAQLLLPHLELSIPLADLYAGAWDPE